MNFRLRPWQLGSIFAIYGGGFVVIFLMFGLLYLRAYRRRHELGLSPLEVFDTRAAGGKHRVSASIGATSALVAPFPWVVFSGFIYFLMGPSHWVYGVRMGRRRKALAAAGTPAAV